MKLDIQTRSERKTHLVTIGSVLLALLASQHHFIHMFIVLITFGSAGMSFMSAYPLIRRGMLLLSLIMVGITIFRMMHRQRSRTMTILSCISIALTLGLILWSVFQFGV